MRGVQWFAAAALMLMVTASAASAQVAEGMSNVLFALGGYSAFYENPDSDVDNYINSYGLKLAYGHMAADNHELGFALDGNFDFTFSRVPGGDNLTSYPVINADLGFFYHAHASSAANDRFDLFFGPNVGISFYFMGEETTLGVGESVKNMTVLVGGFLGADVGMAYFITKHNALLLMVNPKFKINTARSYVTDQGWDSDQVTRFENRAFFGLQSWF